MEGSLKLGEELYKKPWRDLVPGRRRDYHLISCWAILMQQILWSILMTIEKERKTSGIDDRANERQAASLHSHCFGKKRKKCRWSVSQGLSCCCPYPALDPRELLVARA